MNQTPDALTIFGAYGGPNIGDEVILNAVVTEFERRGYKSPYTVVGLGKIEEAGQQAWYDRRGLHYVYGRDVTDAVRAAWGKDLFIGGGQLIDGSHGPKLAALQLLLALSSKASGRKVVLGGVGAYRPASGPITRLLHGLLFRVADAVAVRDADSLNAIQFSSAGRASGTQTADIVFTLLDPNSFTDAARPTIAYCVHNAPHVQYSDRDGSLELIKRVASISGRDLVITAHDKRQNFDLGFAENLAAHLPAGSAAVRTFETVEQCLAFYRTCHTVISARMHPVIIGACLGANTVPLSGSPKMAEVSKLLGVPLQSPQSLLALDEGPFREAIGINSTVAKPDRNVLEGLKARALDNFKLFPSLVLPPEAKKPAESQTA